jgi:hypothetical protein
MGQEDDAQHDDGCAHGDIDELPLPLAPEFLAPGE